MFETMNADGTAQWEIVYDLVREAPVDTVITYAMMDALLARPVQQNRSPVFKAITMLEKNDQKTLANVRGVGYRVARADEHLALAHSKHKSARRMVRKARSKVQSANRDDLDIDQRKRLDSAEANLAAQEAMWTRLDAKVETHEKKIRDLARHQEFEKDRHDDNMAMIERRLAALEAKPTLIVQHQPVSAVEDAA